VESATPSSKDEDDDSYIYTKNPEKYAKYKDKIEGQKKQIENRNKEDDNRKMPAPPNFAFAEQGDASASVEAASGNIDRKVDEFKRSNSPEIPAASLPTKSISPALAPSSNMQEVVPPSPPAPASGGVTSSPVPDNRHAASAESGPAMSHDMMASVGATVINNPLSTESVQPRGTLRQPSVKLYVTDAIVVESSAPAEATPAAEAVPPAPSTDPLCVALEAVDELSSIYMDMGPVTMPLSILQDALEAAVACCDDAIGGPPADLPPLGNDSLGNALTFLTRISKVYRKLGSKGIPITVVREALAKALVRCQNKVEVKRGRRKWGL